MLIKMVLLNAKIEIQYGTATELDSYMYVRFVREHPLVAATALAQNLSSPCITFYLIIVIATVLSIVITTSHVYITMLTTIIFYLYMYQRINSGILLLYRYETCSKVVRAQYQCAVAVQAQFSYPFYGCRVESDLMCIC